MQHQQQKRSDGAGTSALGKSGRICDVRRHLESISSFVSWCRDAMLVAVRSHEGDLDVLRELNATAWSLYTVHETRETLAGFLSGRLRDLDLAQSLCAASHFDTGELFSVEDMEGLVRRTRERAERLGPGDATIRELATRTVATLRPMRDVLDWEGGTVGEGGVGFLTSLGFRVPEGVSSETLCAKIACLLPLLWGLPPHHKIDKATVQAARLLLQARATWEPEEVQREADDALRGWIGEILTFKWRNRVQHACGNHAQLCAEIDESFMPLHFVHHALATAETLIASLPLDDEQRRKRCRSEAWGVEVVAEDGSPKRTKLEYPY